MNCAVMKKVARWNDGAGAQWAGTKVLKVGAEKSSHGSSTMWLAVGDKVGKSRGRVGVEIRKVARGFAGERYRRLAQGRKDLGRVRGSARALEQQDQLGG